MSPDIADDAASNVRKDAGAAPCDDSCDDQRREVLGQGLWDEKDYQEEVYELQECQSAFAQPISHIYLQDSCIGRRNSPSTAVRAWEPKHRQGSMRVLASMNVGNVRR